MESDSKIKLKKYLSPSVGARIMAWLLFAISLLALAIGIIKAIGLGEEGDREPIPYVDAMGDIGAYAYIDVVGVSDWVYNDGYKIYYAVEDEELLYVAALMESQFEALAEQFEYWNREEDAKDPAIYRLYGVITSINNDVRANMADVFDITQSDFDYYFGTDYLDATTTPGEKASGPWFGLALILFLVWFIVGLSVWSRTGVMRRCLRRLDERGALGRVANGLDDPANEILLKDTARLGRDYIYSRASGAVLRYSDIVWAYKRTQSYNFVPVNAFLVAMTKEGKGINLLAIRGSDKTGVIDDVLRVIAERNPNAMLGYTTDNRKAYRAMKKAGTWSI